MTAPIASGEGQGQAVCTECNGLRFLYWDNDDVSQECSHCKGTGIAPVAASPVSATPEKCTICGQPREFYQHHVTSHSYPHHDFASPVSAPALTCVKVPHDNPDVAYLHDESYDSPYDVDGALYCGRCHWYCNANGKCSNQKELVVSTPGSASSLTYRGTDWREVLARNVTVSLEFALNEFSSDRSNLTRAARLVREAAAECKRLLNVPAPDPASAEKPRPFDLDVAMNEFVNAVRDACDDEAERAQDAIYSAFDALQSRLDSSALRVGELERQLIKSGSDFAREYERERNEAGRRVGELEQENEHVTLRELQRINLERKERWHEGGSREWSVLEWAGAMCGEAGEAANVAKKLLRIDLDLRGNEAAEHVLTSRAELRDKLASEIAGTVLYASLLASAVGIDFERAIVDGFNAKSSAMGFPDRLAVGEETHRLKGLLQRTGSDLAHAAGRIGDLERDRASSSRRVGELETTLQVIMAALDETRAALETAYKFAWNFGKHLKGCPLEANIEAPDDTVCSCGYSERADKLMDDEEAHGFDFYKNAHVALAALGTPEETP